LLDACSVVEFGGGEGAIECGACEAVVFETLVILERSEVAYRNGIGLVGYIRARYGIAGVVVDSVRLFVLELGVFG
jgi:hypothetical protein